MPITIKHGSIFDSTADVLVCPVNCGLDWAEVWPLYEKHLGGLDAEVEVWIHESL